MADQGSWSLGPQCSHARPPAILASDTDPGPPLVRNLLILGPGWLTSDQEVCGRCPWRHPDLRLAASWPGQPVIGGGLLPTGLVASCTSIFHKRTTLHCFQLQTARPHHNHSAQYSHHNNTMLLTHHQPTRVSVCCVIYKIGKHQIISKPFISCFVSFTPFSIFFLLRKAKWSDLPTACITY